MPRSARLLAALFLATVISGSQDPWLKITSANFELYTTGGERSGRDLIRHFEQIRSFFGQVFGDNRPKAKPACIVAFRNDNEYAPYRPNEFASAFFHSGSYHDFIVMGGSMERDRIAVHEFTHMMVRESGRDYPPWFNEGLAEFFSTLQPIGNKITVGQGIAGHLMTLQNQKWLPLDALLSVDIKSPYYNEKSKAGVFYAESWKLVHMLFLDPSYRPQLKALDDALKEGGSAAALEAIYHRSLHSIEADLHTYMRGGTINVMVFNLQLPKAVDAPEVTPAAGMSARLALAELLSNTRGGSEQASAAYATLSQEYPKRWEVEAGWGEFCSNQRKLDDAVLHYARAVELGGQDPRLFVEYAHALDYLDRFADAVDILSKAEQLFPGNDEIHFEMGVAYIRHGNYGAGFSELTSVKIVKPAQAYRYFYNMAFAEYLLGKPAEAKANAAKARTFAKTAGELASLDRMDSTLEKPLVLAEVRPSVRDTGDPPDPPRLAPRAQASQPEAPRKAPAPPLPSAEGTFEHLECGKVARLHVRVDSKVRIFVITDPSSVTIGSGNGAPVDLQCGPQHPPRAVRIEYQESAGQPGSPGVVRTLEFK